MAPQKRPASHFTAKNIAVLSAGFWTMYLTEHWTSALTYPFVQDMPWLGCSAFGLIASVFLGIVGDGRSARLSNVGNAVMALLATLGVILTFLTERLGLPPALLAVGVLAVSVGICWFIIQWVRLFAKMSFDKAVLPIALGASIVSVFKIVMAIVPGFPTPIAIAVLPLVCLMCLKKANELDLVDAPEQVQWFTLDAVHSLASSAAAVAIFLFVWSIFNMSLKTSSGHYGYGDLASPALVSMAQAIDIIFATLLACWVTRRKAMPEFNQLWRVAFVCLALSLVAAALTGMFHVAQVFTSAAYEMADAVLWITLADMARHVPGDRSRVIALGFAMILRLPDLLGRVLVNTVQLDILGEVGIVTSMFAILLTVAFLLPHRSPGVQLLFSELSRATTQTNSEEHGSSIEEQCSELAGRFGLTPRELQIIQFLCYGRSKQYIAETLYLSENTVRTYVRRIYAKLDIHSKSELQDMVGIS